MSDPASARSARRSPTGAAADKRSFFERLVEFISPGPDSKAELLKTLADAEHRELIEPESRLMLEGVLRMADLSAGDVMVPTGRMDLLSIDASADEILAAVIDTAHSRFPVFEDARDNIIGILLAKDLLKLQRAPELNLRTLLRPAVFVPESKRLNELLRDFRSNRNHLAVVIDEFGNVAGLITIEDVLEEIVGEIEDDVAVTAVNEAFATQLPEADFDTIGGLVAHEHGRVPRRAEAVTVGGLVFTVMITRGGAVRWFRVARAPAQATTADGGDVD